MSRPGGDRAPTRRFGDRVADYVRYRPSYPSAAIDWIIEQASLRSGDAVADVGAGTGISSRLLLERGLRVFAVEPNDAMRAAAEDALGGRAGFVSGGGTAEATGLADGSVAAVVAAQAFHWFDVGPTRREWVRILRPGGWAVLIWNHRAVDATEFMRGYDALLNKHCPEYPTSGAEHVSVEKIEAFLAPGPIRHASFRNNQLVDLEGLRGRLRSSSYVPREGEQFDALWGEAEALFRRCQSEAGVVSFDYHTRCWAARLAAGG